MKVTVFMWKFIHLLLFCPASHLSQGQEKNSMMSVRWFFPRSWMKNKPQGEVEDSGYTQQCSLNLYIVLCLSPRNTPTINFKNFHD